MSETEKPVVKDWRGKEIKIGKRVLWSGESGTGIGTVHMILKATWGNYYHVFVNWHEHSRHKNDKSQPLNVENLTVLDDDVQPHS